MKSQKGRIGASGFDTEIQSGLRFYDSVTALVLVTEVRLNSALF